MKKQQSTQYLPLEQVEVPRFLLLVSLFPALVAAKRKENYLRHALPLKRDSIHVFFLS